MKSDSKWNENESIFYKHAGIILKSEKFSAFSYIRIRKGGESYGYC